MARAKDIIIQGKPAGSINEANVADALIKLGYEFEFQYYFGGAGLRGSQIIDFLVFTPPRPTPLFVHGKYWHTNSNALEEELKMAEITSRTRGTWAQPVIIWDYECESVEQAKNILLGRL